MTTRWNEVVTLAREIERARRGGWAIEPEKARRLARAVLALKEGPRRDAEGAPQYHLRPSSS
jgi:hypothetical protein